MPDLDAVRARLEAGFDSLGVSRQAWACGEFREACYCLVWAPGRWAEWSPDHSASGRDGRWQAGYVERGEMTVKFQAADTDEAIGRFLGWVSEAERRNREGAEQTARWLREHGRQPPR